MHDGLSYDPIQDRGQETLKFRNSSMFEVSFFPIHNGCWQTTTQY